MVSNYNPIMFGGNNNRYATPSFGQTCGFNKVFGQSAHTESSQNQSMNSYAYSQNNNFLNGGTRENVFGQFATPVQTYGTPIKYNPIIDKSGFSSGERYNSILCMDTYKNKSLEELRWEDYQREQRDRNQGAMNMINAPLSQNTFSQQHQQEKVQPGFLNQFNNYEKPAFQPPKLTPMEKPKCENMFNVLNQTSSFGLESTKQPAPIIKPTYTINSNSNNLQQSVSYNLNNTKTNDFNFGQPTNLKFCMSSPIQNLTSLPPSTTNITPPMQFNLKTPDVSLPTVTQPTSQPLYNTIPIAPQNLPGTLTNEFHQHVQKVFQPFPRKGFLSKVKPNSNKEKTTDRNPIRNIFDEIKSLPKTNSQTSVIFPKKLRQSTENSKGSLLDDIKNEFIKKKWPVRRLVITNKDSDVSRNQFIEDAEKGINVLDNTRDQIKFTYNSNIKNNNSSNIEQNQKSLSVINDEGGERCFNFVKQQRCINTNEISKDVKKGLDTFKSRCDSKKGVKTIKSDEMITETYHLENEINANSNLEQKHEDFIDSYCNIDKQHNRNKYKIKVETKQVNTPESECDSTQIVPVPRIVVKSKRFEKNQEKNNFKRNLNNHNDNNSDVLNDNGFGDHISVGVQRCSVKLTDKEYYTNPPIENLSIDDNGDCIVENFEIGRKGFGKIKFLDPVNLSNLDLDEIIEIDYRVVTVYPDDDKKPPIGQGLNVKAEITMDQVWPIDKQSYITLEEVEDEEKANFINRLKLLSKKQNSSFVNYLPDTVCTSYFADTPATEICLRCIGIASSGDNLTKACKNDACGVFRIKKQYWMESGNWTFNDYMPDEHDSCTEKHCGPVGIQNEQWVEANRPTLNRLKSSDSTAFLTCAGSAHCSYFVVQRYMEKYQKDCNGDGQIDCYDFASILRFGPDNCDQEWPEVIGSDFVDMPASEVCLGCICRAASGCDIEKECENNACGPYRITKDYWMDSGNWTYNDHSPKEDKSYIKCVTNYYCSTFTVQEYIKKFKKDCNGDGVTNCEDFAAIHALGSTNCHKAWPKAYKELILPKKFDKPVSVRCFNCLCQAASGCSIKNICRDNYCGPFGIRETQWIEAKKPTVNRVKSTHEKAFFSCANNFYCSYFIIQRYIEKHQKDCNGDGNIDCDDFMAIHRLGPSNCSLELPETYQERYEYCQALVSD
ncbi:hypothetical protein FQA39_LY08801 [Lamprigera yunnana]|nr:hypothetical protein FQA39_LY08801 [Lamprigera yunnana]